MMLRNLGERSTIFVHTFLSLPGEQYKSLPGEQYKSTNSDVHLQLIVLIMIYTYIICVINMHVFIGNFMFRHRNLVIKIRFLQSESSYCGSNPNWWLKELSIVHIDDEELEVFHLWFSRSSIRPLTFAFHTLMLTDCWLWHGYLCLALYNV